jgi:hypothetical protein
MQGKGIIGNFFHFCDLFSDPLRELELLIEAREFDICEDDSLVCSLVLVDFPGLSIRMTVVIADLVDFWMSDHDIESYAIGNFPFELISYIGISFFSFFLYFKSETSFLFPCLHVFDEANTEFVPISSMDGGLCIVE